MSVYDKPDNQIDGQVSFEHIYESPARLIAVSRIFARARKQMSLNEQKAFVYALSQMDFKKAPESEYVKLDKKVLAKILDNHSDIDHLSQNLYDEIKELPAHSYLEIAEKDLGLYSNGFFVTSVTRFKNILRVRLNGEYLALFTNLEKDYITMWSSDIFQMTTKRSVQFYEYLRQITDTREEINSVLLGVRALKEMFDIPKEGQGSYMRDGNHFNRYEFERKVIDPLCDDMKKCKMINLIMQPDGKMYEKVKRGNRVYGYRFYWTFSAYPAVATASDVKQILERVDKNPQVLKVAKDIVKGETKPKPKKTKNAFHNFEQRNIDYTSLLEGELGARKKRRDRKGNNDG